ncbi:MAG TPA: pseudouridine synthase [Chryseosolibacter sp.]|nr:pseudouridine synthase [Chryseosolibacter sp.]
MPKRRESGRERKDSSSSRGGRSHSSGKSFKKSSREDSTPRKSAAPGSKPFKRPDTRSPKSASSGSHGRRSDSKRPSGRYSEDPDRKARFTKSGGKGYGPPRSRDEGGKFSTRNRTRSSDNSGEGKGLSKKSRFARSGDKHFGPPRTREEGSKYPARNKYTSSDDSGEGKRPGRPRFSRSDDKRVTPPSSREGGEKFSSRSRPRSADGAAKSRGGSFGKPYKKTYKARPERGPFISTGKRAKVQDESTGPKSDQIRLNKFIANSGISSRREADELITMGLISVNGKVVTELGYKVNPTDEIRYEDKVLRPERPVYILMNKPKGFLTTTDDPQERKTVMHIIGSAVKERIYPVGRLDRNTTGLLLLTNDGGLADKLMHPSFNVKKVYKVELDRPLTKNDFQAIKEGVRLEEGRAEVDDVAIVSDDNRTVGIELHIGWNRVVRRIFESLGYEVVKLDRTAYAGLDKKELGRGQWRFLTKEEIIHLKHFN